MKITHTLAVDYVKRMRELITKFREHGLTDTQIAQRVNRCGKGHKFSKGHVARYFENSDEPLGSNVPSKRTIEDFEEAFLTLRRELRAGPAPVPTRIEEPVRREQAGNLTTAFFESLLPRFTDAELVGIIGAASKELGARQRPS